MRRTFVGDQGQSWSYDDAAALGKPGAFGAVYPGTGADGNDVAVKVVERPDLSARLLQREVEIARTLATHHLSYVIHTLDAGMDGRRVVIVMERADGSLQVPRGGLAETEAASVLRDVVSGLVELHGIGIIHRDLKPSNVLHAGHRWKLADFGIARDQSVGTQSQTFLGWGTNAYMAPELWDQRSPTVKSDLYALGCIAFELLTGRTPFAGPEPGDYRRQHLQDAPPALPDEVNAGLRTLVQRLLAKDPGQRHQDARAVLERLERIALPLSPLQQELSVLEAQHASERAAIEVARAKHEAEEERREGLRQQALADLAELVEDAHVLAAGGADVSVTVQNYRFKLASEDASLTMSVFEHFRYSPVAGDTMILGAECVGMNRRDGGLRLANLIYEVVRDRYGWQLYRFRQNGLMDPSHYRPYGPTDREHGLEARWFLDEDERGFMLRPITHIWSLRTKPASPEDVVALFAEALALQGRPGI